MNGVKEKGRGSYVLLWVKENSRRWQGGERREKKEEKEKKKGEKEEEEDFFLVIFDTKDFLSREVFNFSPLLVSV